VLDLIAGDRNRTYDPRITNALLYQLSYSGAKGGYVKQSVAAGQQAVPERSRRAKLTPRRDAGAI